MATKHPELFAALAAPFEPGEIKWRPQGGRMLCYVTARTVENRLDDVFGPEGWRDEYEPHEKSVLCKLHVRLPDGEWLCKQDAGGYAGMADSGDDDKSGYSDAFKRAAVKWGVGRYLYRDGVPGFVTDHYGVEASTPPADPGVRPASEVPAPRRGGNGRATTPPAAARPSGNGQAHGDPRTGKALFAWCKDMEQRYEVGVIKYLNQFMKLQNFPGRMVELNEDQVRVCLEEARRKLKDVANRGDAYEEAISN